MLADVVVERRAGRLPAELTSFIGRAGELADVKRLLGRSRLVTLAGPGGVGKSRIAVRAASDAAPGYPDGVAFVDLGSLSSPELLPHTVADALGLVGQTAGDQVETLAAFLEDRSLLLVLDTCEHVVDACALLSEVLLRAAPELRILATSRQPLDVIGEHTLMVAPLGGPGDGGEGLEDADSVKLFADRAAAIAAGWAITRENRPAVARLCRRLEGIPLAIELAAVQLRAFSVEQIAERLDERFLSVRARRGQGRHQTLRAAIGWSQSLCTDLERLLWARLSVFAGDFELAAAEEVCAGGELPADEVAFAVAGLVEKSILLRTGDGPVARYRMLDTIREFGAEQLGGDLGELALRHRDWYVAFAEDAQRGFLNGRQADRMAAMTREKANLRAAVERSLDLAGTDRLLTLGLALGRSWILTGTIGEGRIWCERILGAANVAGFHGPALVEMYLCTGALAILQNDLPAARKLAAEARRRLEAGEGDTDREAYVLTVESLIGLFEHDHVLVVSAGERARELHAVADRPDILRLIGDIIICLAALLEGDFPRAERLNGELAELCERTSERWCGAYSLMIDGLLDHLNGRREPAGAKARAALRTKWELADRLGISIGLDLCNLTCADDPVHGARLFGATDRLRELYGMSMFGAGAELLLEERRVALRDALGPAEFDRHHRAGATAELTDMVGAALGEDVTAGVQVPAPRQAEGPLTKRELEIAELVAEGMSNREIAERLFVAKRTVDSHLEHILGKLGFTSRTQVATWLVSRARSF